MAVSGIGEEIGYPRVVSHGGAYYPWRNWNRSQAAEILGIDRKTLRLKMKRMAAGAAE